MRNINSFITLGQIGAVFILAGLVSASAQLPVITGHTDPDGEVVIGGNFSSLNGVPRNDVARLYGAVDVYDAVDADGDLLPNAWESQYGSNPEVPNLEVGTGRDGPLTVGDLDCYTDEVWAQVVASNPAGQANLNVSSTDGFAVSNLVLMITMQDPNPNLTNNTAGTFEFGRIASLGNNTFTLTQPRTNSFNATNSEKIQVLKVPEYTDVSFRGSALSFDGVNDYVDLPDGVYFLGGDFTIEAWIYPKAYSLWARLLDFGNGQNAGNSAVILTFCTDQGALTPVLAVGGQNIVYANCTLRSNTWVHLAVTLRNRNVTYFTNGVFAGSGVLSYPPVSVVRTNNLIAKSNWTNDPNSEVMLDEFRIWSVARSRYDIATNMRRTLIAQEPGLVACYSFNEGIGTTAFDSGPNHLNGTFHGTANGPTRVPSPFGWLTCHPYDGAHGGVLAFLAHSINLGGCGVISADGKGYRGGAGVPSAQTNHSFGITGEGTTGYSTAPATNVAARPQGGGGASQGAAASGAGGAYGSAGERGSPSANPGGDSSVPGIGADAFGFSDLRRLYLGGGGGGSGAHRSGRVGVAGGAGGGVVFVAAGSIQGGGAISSRGAPGQQGVYSYSSTSGAGGGGGAGGSIYVMGWVPNSLQILASAGAGGPHDPNPSCTNSSNGGAGGVGRIRLDIPASGPVPYASPAPGCRTQLSAVNPVTSRIWGACIDSDANADGLPDWWEFRAGLNPTNNLDAGIIVPGDQLTYFQKFVYGLNPSTPDTDGDGVSDYDELFVYHTDPLHADSSLGTRYYYDALNRLTGAHYGNGLLLRYEYDRNNNIVRQAYLQGDANANGLPDFWESNNGLTNDASAYLDTDGDGWTDYQEWKAGTDPNHNNSSPSATSAAITIASTDWPFTPTSFCVGVGQLYGTGPEQIVIGADGNPGTTTNFLLVLSQTRAGWTNVQRVDIGGGGVTSIAVGQPANRPAPAIYLGLRQSGGAGRVMEFVQSGGIWSSNTIANSTNNAAFVLGVRPSGDVVVSLAGTNDPPGTAYYVSCASDVWAMTSANPSSSQRGLGTILMPNPQGVSRQCARLLDSGGVQVFGGLPVTARWNPDCSRWFFLTAGPAGWEESEAYAESLGGKLATVTNQTLNSWIWNEFRNTGTFLYIGLFREACGTPWQWASGAPVSYTHWDTGEPNCSDGYEFFAGMRAAALWNDFPAGIPNFGVVETPIGGPYCSAAEPAGSSRLLWRGRSLTSGRLRSGNLVSVLYTSIEDQNANGVVDAGDNFLIAEYLLDGCQLSFFNAQRRPLSGSALAPSYGLTSADVLYGDSQALFTAEPDGRVYLWSATNATAPLQKLLFSDAYAGKAWHALAAVKGLETAQSIVGLSVAPASPNRCDVVLWPPQQQRPVPVDVPQTAPITCIISASPALGTVSVELMTWDAEGNASRPELQYLLAGQNGWVNATVTGIDGTTYTTRSFVETHPNGRVHQLSWSSAQDLPLDYTNTVALRARSTDITLTGPWSPPVNLSFASGSNLHATNDVASTLKNAPVTIDVLANDAGRPKHIFAVAVPLHGSALAQADFINYLPARDFVGIDEFVYTITDGAGAYHMATVTVIVTDVGQSIVLQAPSAQGGQFSMEIWGAPGQVYEIQASTNLTDWVYRQRVTNLPSGMVPFSEPIQTNAPTRFYRAWFVP